MSEDGSVPIDTRDMVAVHGVFRRALGDARGQLASVSDGDTARARYLADYLGEVLWLLHAHHVGEDELLYPLLSDRVPEARELFARMDAQHTALSSDLERAERAAERFAASGTVADRQALVDACESLRDSLGRHLDEEEEEVLPIAAQHISPPEWGALPAHALAHYSGSRVWLPFGLVLEAMPGDVRENLLAHVPPPVSGMWHGGGSDAFEQEIAAIRG